jgi:excisionase family DNA binding protein
MVWIEQLVEVGAKQIELIAVSLGAWSHGAPELQETEDVAINILQILHDRPHHSPHFCRVPRTISGTTIYSPAASPAMLDVQAVAEMLGCSQRHVYRLSDAGRMPSPVKLGSLSRWSAVAIREWIEGGCKPVRTVKGGA